MFNMLERIDGFLIDKVFQPIANRFEKLFGKDCFFLDGLMFGGVLFCMVFRLALQFSISELIFVLLLAGIVLPLYPTLNRKKRERISSGFMNRERVDSFSVFIRLFILALTIVAWAVFLTKEIADTELIVERITIFQVGFLLSSFYFSACTPRPPCKSWVAKFIEKLRAAVSEIATPAPEPVRVQYRS